MHNGLSYSSLETVDNIVRKCIKQGSKEQTFFIMKKAP